MALALSMGAAAALAKVARPTRRLADSRTPIRLEALFPTVVGEWQLDPRAVALVRPPTEQGKLYGIYDELLERTYVSPSGARMMLSVAYGREQSLALQMHAPEVCYRWAGFEVDQLRRLTLHMADRSIPATRLLAALPGRIEPITYWNVLGDEVIENDGRTLNWRRFSFGVRGQILDGMLVRVSSIDANTERAWRSQEVFASEMVAAINPTYRARVIGAASAP